MLLNCILVYFRVFFTYMKRLIVLLSVFAYCTVAIAQHPHSKGGNPLYWALVGGISAGLYYAIFRGIPFIISHLKRRKKNNDDESIVESRVIETENKELDIISTDENNEIDNQLPNELMNISVNDDSSTKDAPHNRTKKQIILAGVIFCILSLLSIFVIEHHINNKKETLSRELERQVMNSFNSDEDWPKRFVEALAYKNIEDLEYEEITIPDFPNNGDKSKKRHWTNMFSDVEHLYKLTNCGWTMQGYVYHREWNEPFNEYSYSILQHYIYFPHLICVPKEADFNIQIAQAIINRALDSFYKDPKECEVVYNAIAYPNEYFYLGLHDLSEREPNYSRLHYFDQSIGNDPIYDNGKFTGNYWYTMQRIGPYRILYAYRNLEQVVPQEHVGFNASRKDRLLYYGLTFLFLTLLFVLYLFKDRIKLKPIRLSRREKSDNQMYCKHCGKLVDSDSEFCKYCGKNL